MKNTSGRIVIAKGFTAKGTPDGMGISASGYAINPEIQSEREIMKIVNKGQKGPDKEQQYVDLMSRLPGGPGKKQYTYDNPFVNRGGSRRIGVAPENFTDDTFIVVGQRLAVDHAWCYLLPQLAGAVIGDPNNSSHAAVVMRERNLPVVLAVPGVEKIRPGDWVAMAGDGEVIVNGGGEFLGEGQSADLIGRFVWVRNRHLEVDIDPRKNEANTEQKSHAWMQKQLDPTFKYEDDTCMGAVLDNGECTIYNPDVPNIHEIEAWARERYPEIRNFVHSTAPLAAPSAPQENRPVEHVEADGGFDDMFASTKPKCPKCGSHTSKLLDAETKKFVCHTCGNEWTNPDVVRTATVTCPTCGGLDALFLDLKCGTCYNTGLVNVGATKYSPGTRVEITRAGKKGQKGSVVETLGEDETFGDELVNIILDNGDFLEGVPSSAFEKIKSASFLAEGRGSKEPPGDIRQRKHYFDPEEDNSDVVEKESPKKCPKCGSSDTVKSSSGQRRCNNCHTYFADESGGPRKSKVSKIADVNGDDLQLGKTYIMHSTKYKVPDIVTIHHLNPNQIVATIQGDDKARFPIRISLEDYEKNHYTFDPRVAAMPGEFGTTDENDEGYYEFGSHCPECGKQLHEEFPGKAYCEDHGYQGTLQDDRFIKDPYDQYGLPIWQEEEKAHKNLQGLAGSGTFGDEHPWSCPECGSEAKDEANNCLDCGYYNPTYTYGPEHGSIPTVGDNLDVDDMLHDNQSIMSHVAKRGLSAKEQAELINEPGVARNIDKLDLDGTHYVTKEKKSKDEELDKWFLW